jgi:HAD superfamily hydrolase (TIGR01509 family)
LIEALLWDVDGTLAETERDGHRVAFNRAFELLGLTWHWDQAYYGELLAVTGGRERLLFDMGRRADAPPGLLDREVLASKLHRAKNDVYADLVAHGTIGLRDGVRELMEECRSSGVPMAIATTTSRANVDALLLSQIGRSWNGWFGAVVCGEDVIRKKPDPEVYLQALHALAVAPGDAVAIEDSPPGVAAARAAGVPVVVTRSTYFADAQFPGAIATGPGLHQARGWQPELPVDLRASSPVGLAHIATWHDGRATPAPGT